MRQIRKEIEINASAERVWQILTDFAAFPKWNPFIREISGELNVGGKLDVRLQLSGERSTRFHPVVLAATPYRELRWLGRLWRIPKLFDGEHSLTIVSLDTTSIQFTQHEVFTGMLIPLLGDTFAGVELGFVEMNEALKERAEGSAQHSRNPDASSLN